MGLVGGNRPSLGQRDSSSCDCLHGLPPTHRQQDLYRILKAYTIYRPDEGYCQAQAPVAAVLLMHMPAEVSTPWALLGRAWEDLGVQQ